MDIAAVALIVSVVGFFAGVIFYMGKYAARLESLEVWRSDVKDEFDRFHAALRHIEVLIRGEREQ